MISGWGQCKSAFEALAAEIPSTRPVRMIAAHEIQATSLEYELRASEPPWDLIGWSMGGMLALETVLNEPKLPIARLVLLGSSACFLEHPEAGYFAGPRASDLAMMVEALERAPQALFEAFYQKVYSAPFLKLNGSAKVAFSLNLNQEILKDGLKYLSQFDVRARLKSIQLQTLLVHGARDEIIPLAAAEYLNAHLPQASLLVLSERGHGFVEEAVGEYAPQVVKFLCEVPRNQ